MACSRGLLMGTSAHYPHPDRPPPPPTPYPRHTLHILVLFFFSPIIHPLCPGSITRLRHLLRYKSSSHLTTRTPATPKQTACPPPSIPKRRESGNKRKTKFVVKLKPQPRLEPRTMGARVACTWCTRNVRRDNVCQSPSSPQPLTSLFYIFSFSCTVRAAQLSTDRGRQSVEHVT